MNMKHPFKEQSVTMPLFPGIQQVCKQIVFN